ncbi:MAG: hypothetical protein L6R42_001308 [Xanthoria sp. 1 TBL-2021]|nr:MAG: hypothetical protein L6R42_001308 [Xanthoria sp. 1 TBL-2021]
MAEVFSAFAGVASLIDVALRACNVLYDSSRYLKDAPQLSQRLRRTIQSVESVLQNLKEFVALHRQQQASAGLPDFLPGAVNEEIISIKAELDTLSTLLPASGSSGQFRAKLKWVLDRKKVTEVIKALDSHQITLILALQSFAQRNGIGLQNDLVRRLEHIYRQDEDSAKNLRDELVSGNARLHADLSMLAQTSQALLPAQESLRYGFANLHEAVSTGQNTVIERLNTIGESLSQIQIRDNHLQSSTVLTAPTEDVLPRLVRAELLRVIMPTVQQCFDTFKGNRDTQLEDIRKMIDQMAQQLGSRSSGNEHDNVKVKLSHGSLPEIGSAPSHICQDSADLATPRDRATIASSISNYQNQPKGRHYQKWSYPWIFRWKIGTLRVTISTQVTKRKISPDYRADGFLSPQKSYRVTIEFVPAQALIQLRGLNLSVANTQDQRGYYQICPFLSTFAVIPKDAEIMRFVMKNNIEGIQDLFQRGLAAPSDREEDGTTLLMVDSDTMEATSTSQSCLIDCITQAQAFSGKLGRLRTLDSPYFQQLKQYNYSLSTLEDHMPAVLIWVSYVQREFVKPSPEGIRSTLQILLGFGADICARLYGVTPLYYLFISQLRLDTNEEQYENTIEIAIALLENGADLFALNDNGVSVFDIVIGTGWTSELVLVLQRTGYDLDEVRNKIYLAQWAFRNPGHSLAESTALDRAQIEPPSTAGLVSRRAVAGDRFEE